MGDLKRTAGKHLGSFQVSVVGRENCGSLTILESRFDTEKLFIRMEVKMAIEIEVFSVVLEIIKLEQMKSNPSGWRITSSYSRCCFSRE